MSSEGGLTIQVLYLAKHMGSFPSNVGDQEENSTRGARPSLGSRSPTGSSLAADEKSD